MSFDELKNPDFVPDVEILPLGYEKNKDGIFKIIVKRGKTGGKNSSLSPISHTPVTVKSKLCNPDTGEVSYNLEFDGKTVTVPGCDLSQKKGIMQLAGQGLLTTDKWARELSEYLIKTIKLNELPETRIYDRMGWKQDGFVLGQTFYSIKGRAPVTLKGAEKQAKAIHSAGTISGWIYAISGLMEYDTQRFKIYIAAVPPFLKQLHEDNFSVNDYGRSSVGKTLTTKVGMSMYGLPKDLLFSGNTTKVGMERAATQFCDIPINLDDIQKVKKETLDALVYIMGNGVGKLRGAKLGGLQEVLTWRTVGMFTGEIPIINDTTFMGINARLIELYGGLKKVDEAAVIKFERGIKENYGTFAPLLIEYLIMNTDAVVSIHEASLQTMRNVADRFKGNKEISGIANRLSNTFATILTAGKVFEELYKNEGGKEKDPAPIIINVFENVISGSASESYALKGLNHIISWIVSNKSNFLLDGKRTVVVTKDSAYDQKYKIFGSISDNYYDILSSELRIELEMKKLNPDRLIKEFFEMGLLETDKGKCIKTVKMEKQGVRVYRFKREKLKEIGFNTPEEGED